MSTYVTIAGNLAADPELRFSAQGKPILKFTVITSRRTKTTSGEWEDADVTGWPVTAFDRLAENAAESLTKGTPVVVSGRAASRSWDDKEGQRRSRVEVVADDVAVSLRRVSARVTRNERARGDDAGWTAPAEQDPWAPAPADDIPPF